MKCAAYGYEFDYKQKKGDGPFLRLNDCLKVQSYGDIIEYSTYVCPKCGTVKVEL